MVRVNGRPFLFPLWQVGNLLVDEVAATAVTAVSFFGEGMTALCFV